MYGKKVMAAVLCFVFVATALNAVVAAPRETGHVNAVTGERLYVAMQQDMPNFNNFDLGSNSIWKANVIGWCFDALSRLDTDGNLVPAMAENWSFDDINLVVDVTVRSGIMFHDGTEMTVDDIIFSYQALRMNCTVSSPLVDTFDNNDDGIVTMAEINAGVQKVDDTHIKFTMAKPYGQFFLGVLGLPIIPKHIWQDHLNADGTASVQWGDSADAVIGTGPYMYTDGTKDVFRLLTRFEGFWGKDFVTPAGAKIWPAGVNEIYFKIYSNIDTAVLALESGDVDYIAWAVTPGKIPEVQANPNTQITFMPDNGYFYLAFNQKREPMNLLPFRQAVSHVIDKTTAVQSYMGGYGVAGDSCEPPFWTQWYNSSVEHYTFSLDAAKAILDDAGIVDTDSDGWRNLPDGRAIQPITLLTPPADYDPIRIKIGQMVATNLKAIGIDCTAKPVNFDTLVANMNSFAYQMLELGWSLTSDPIANVFDILGPTALSNTFGFWSAANPNPYYGSTMADAQTQVYADQIAVLADLAKQTFDPVEQIKYTKEAQGIMSKAIPVNVMYYRVAAEGSSKAWTGWTPFMGSLWNAYTLANLERSSAPPPKGDITAILTAPAKVPLGEDRAASVYVYDNNNLPVSGANVVVASSTANATVPAGGLTGADGYYRFNITGASEGLTVISAEVTKGTMNSSAQQVVSVYSLLPRYLYLTAAPEKYFLAKGESVKVNLTAKDEKGTPVEGATIVIDPAQLGVGSINKQTLTTDASGNAQVTYTAPTNDTPNAHASPILAMQVSKDGFGMSANVQLNLVIVNSAASNWKFVKVTAMDRKACNLTNANVTLNISAGANDEITAVYSDESLLVSPVNTITMDGTGKGTLTVEFNAVNESGSVRVSFMNQKSAYSIGTTVSIPYSGNGTNATPIYGGMVSIANHELAPFGNISVQVDLWDVNGNAPANVRAAIAVTGTPDGAIGTINGVTTYDPAIDYAGLVITSTNDKGDYATSGPFACDFDRANLEFLLEAIIGITPDPNWTQEQLWSTWAENWIGDPSWPMPTGVNITNGTATFQVDGQMASLRDLVSSVVVVPGGIATFDTANWYISGYNAFSSEFVTLRGMSVVTAKYDVKNPVMSTKGEPANTTVDIVAYDQDNNPIQGADASAAAKIRTSSTFTITKCTPVPTDANGKATVLVEPNTATLKTAKLATSPVKSDMFVYAAMAGYVNVLQVTQIVITPQLMQLDISAPTSHLIDSVGTQTFPVTATATAADGSALAGVNVTITSSYGSVSPDYMLTDANGTAAFDVSFSPPMFESAALIISLTGKGEADLTQGTSSGAQVRVYAAPPAVAIAEPVDASTVETYEDYAWVPLKGTVTDAINVSYVHISVDGGNWTPAAITAGPSVAFNETLNVSANAAGVNHTVDVKAANVLNVTSMSSLVFMAKTMPKIPPAVNITSPAAGLLIPTTMDYVHVTVNATITDDISVTDVHYKVDSGAWVAATITAGPSVAFSQAVNITATANETAHTVYVKAINVWGLTDEMNVTFSVLKAAKTPPTVTITAPTPNYAFEPNAASVTVTVTGTATDNLNVDEVYVSVDSGAPVKLTITPGKSVAFSYDRNFTATETKATHTVTVKAVNAWGLNSTQSVTFTVQKVVPEDKKEADNTMLIVGVVVVVLIVVVLIALLMRKKPASGEESEEESGEEEEEEGEEKEEEKDDEGEDESEEEEEKKEEPSKEEKKPESDEKK